MQQPQSGQSATPPDTNDVQLFISRGISRFRMIGTIIALIVLLLAFLAIAAYEGLRGLPFIASTIIGLLFMAGFVWYLKLITPVPFTLRVDSAGLLKEDQRGDRLSLSWHEVAGVKEQVFRNGKLVALIIYREAEPHPQKALAIYRDDIDDIAAYRDAVRRWLPAGCSWQREQVVA